MKMEEIIGLGVRLCSIVLFLYVVGNFPGMLVYFSDENRVQFWLLAAVMAFLLVVVILLWNFPITIARKIAPSSASDMHTSWDSVTLIAVGSTLLGIYFLYYSISDLLYWLFFGFYSQNVGGVEIELSIDQKASIVVSFIEFAIAVFLIGGSGFLSRAIHLLRYGSAYNINK
jgi:divalent metal cation (Fe/Co/Zn/Cd) transporter